MKAKPALLALGLVAALQAVAADQPTSVNASSTAAQPAVQRSIPVLEIKSDLVLGVKNDQSKIINYNGNMSSQAWATIATRQSNDSQFNDCKDTEASLCLLSVNW
jgi:hypothetical protein